jgi:hypothetical protein
MSLMTRLRLTEESSLEEGTPEEVMEKKRRALDEQLARRRGRGLSRLSRSLRLG